MTKWLQQDKWRAACVGLAIIAAILLTVGLGGTALTDYDEATYGIITKNMSESGDYMTPRYLESNWFEKPPLYFWSAAISGSVFTNTEFAYRLPAALMGLLSIVLVMLIGYHITKRYSAAFLSGLILLTTGAYFEAARQVRLDVPVTAGILLAFYGFLKGRADARWYLLMGLGVGIAVLMKGVIGLFAGPLLLIWAITMRDFSWLKEKYFWFAILVALAIITPWHIYESMLFGREFWFHYVGQHVFDRFESNILSNASAGTNATYMNFLWAFAFPWSVMFVIALVQLFRMQKHSFFRPALVLALQVAFVCSVFFIAGTKMGYYLTPAYPFVALFLAVTGSAFFESIGHRNRTIVTVVAAILVVAALANMYIVGYRHHVAFANIDAVAHDERAVGLAIRGEDSSLPVYTYGFLSWETLIYYGGRPIRSMTEDQLLDRSFLLAIPRAIANASPFPPDLAAHLKPVYVGETLVLLRFDL